MAIRPGPFEKHPSNLRRLIRKYGNRYNRSSFSDEKLFESVDGRRRRATEPACLISSPGAFGSFKLKHQASFQLNASNEYLFVLKNQVCRR